MKKGNASLPGGSKSLLEINDQKSSKKCTACLQNGQRDTVDVGKEAVLRREEKTRRKVQKKPSPTKNESRLPWIGRNR